LGDGLKEYAKYFAFFVVLAAVLFGGVHVLRSVLGTQYPIMVVVSESMIPTLGVGDFIFVDHIENFDEMVAAPRPEGEIIVFKRFAGSDEYIVHRAVSKFSRGGSWWFVTKGDNNLVEDASPVREEDVMGRVVSRVPVFGYFPLFIKTSRGFSLVAGLMIVIFFADYIMPDKREGETGGGFPWASVIPFFASPLVYLASFSLHDFPVELELLSLASWYIGCLVAPIAFEDDDMGLMFWLYHFVLIMIPMGCDLVWRVTGITPSMWWSKGGSTVPITWLLQQETRAFYDAFNRFALLLVPGCALFLVLVAVKRRGAQKLVALNKWARRAPEEQPSEN
jgi:signal peptidase